MARRAWAIAATALLALACQRTQREPLPAAAAPSPAEVPAPVASVAVPAAPAPPAPDCGDAGEVTVFVSPAHPVKGQPVRIVAVADRKVNAQLEVTGEDGAAAGGSAAGA